MSFPDQIFGINIGWKDRGEIEAASVMKDDKIIALKRTICPECNTIVHIGLERGKRFRFCPKCLLIVPKKN